MSTRVEVFYSFQSPYSYLALESIYDLKRRFDVELLWQPFSARASGNSLQSQGITQEHTSTRGESLILDKISYMLEDTKRMASDQGMPLTFPKGWPESEFDPDRAIRGAIVANDLDVLLEYNVKVFHCCWGLGQDPNEENFINELCEDLDVDLGEFLSKMSSSDTRERVKGIYKRGRRLGVFDTPTLVIGEERFVGPEKIEAVARRLEKLGHRKAA